MERSLRRATLPSRGHRSGGPGRAEEASRHAQAAYEQGGGWAIRGFVAAFWGERDAHGHREAAREVRQHWLRRNASLAHEGEPSDRSFYAWALMGERRNQEAQSLFTELADADPEDVAAPGLGRRRGGRAGDRETAVATLSWLEERTGRTPPTGARAWQALIHAAMGHGEVVLNHFRQAMSERVYNQYLVASRPGRHGARGRPVDPGILRLRTVTPPRAFPPVALDEPLGWRGQRSRSKTRWGGGGPRTR